MENISIEEAGKQQRREYEKQWRAKNKDKVAAKNRRYWAKKAAAAALAASVLSGENNDGRQD